MFIPGTTVQSHAALSFLPWSGNFYLLFLFPCLLDPSLYTIFILVSKVGIDRTDSLGTGTVVFCVLFGWYSSTRQCDSSTVALDMHHHISIKVCHFESCSFASDFLPSGALLDRWLACRRLFRWCWNLALGCPPLPCPLFLFCAILEHPFYSCPMVKKFGSVVMSVATPESIAEPGFGYIAGRFGFATCRSAESSPPVPLRGTWPLRCLPSGSGPLSWRLGTRASVRRTGGPPLSGDAQFVAPSQGQNLGRWRSSLQVPYARSNSLCFYFSKSGR